jgi:hypothetical protein
MDHEFRFLYIESIPFASQSQISRLSICHEFFGIAVKMSGLGGYATVYPKEPS